MRLQQPHFWCVNSDSMVVEPSLRARGRAGGGGCFVGGGGGGGGAMAGASAKRDMYLCNTILSFPKFGKETLPYNEGAIVGRDSMAAVAATVRSSLESCSRSYTMRVCPYKLPENPLMNTSAIVELG